MKKIIMVGSNPRTRGAIPWDAEAEFWTLNEAPMNAWMKRWDVLFQIHKRWDWERSNNLAHPNHPLFLKAQSGECLYCKGSGKAYADGKEVACPWCVDGIYIVPDHRYMTDVKQEVSEHPDGSGAKILLSRPPKTIIMQDDNDDVPGCSKFPVGIFTDENDKVYLTSTLAHMLAYAISIYPKLPIELYGFEAESNTEYAAQRPCIEYWVGYGRGLGMSIEAPGSGLLKGRHYAYDDYDQGYRSRLEMRKHALQEQLHNAEVESVKSEGELNALTPYRELPVIVEAWNNAYDDHFRKKNFVSFLRGTLKELDRAIEILDAYRQDTDEATKADMRRLIEIPYSLG
jgi:hypothetical protein